MRDNQLKIIKYNHLIANLLIFHNCRTITLALKELGTKACDLRRTFTHLRRILTPTQPAAPGRVQSPRGGEITAVAA